MIRVDNTNIALLPSSGQGRCLGGATRAVAAATLIVAALEQQSRTQFALSSTLKSQSALRVAERELGAGQGEAGCELGALVTPLTPL